MTFGEHLIEFAGHPVIDWERGDTIDDSQNFLFRLRIDWDAANKGDRWDKLFQDFLAEPNATEARGIVVGAWETAYETSSASIIQALVDAKDELKQLHTVFIGDMVMEESEVSWITQSDVEPLLQAYPHLVNLGIRGGNELHFGRTPHNHLQRLVIQTGGLPQGVLEDVLASELPALEHLELWLGTDNYGWNGTVDQFEPLFQDKLFPKLTYLGLRNSEIADEIAVKIADAPILKRLHVLDLSLGTLGDTGAAALSASQMIQHLQKLDLHHHYCGGAAMEALKKLSMVVDLDDPQTPSRYDWDKDNREWRYTAVGE